MRKTRDQRIADMRKRYHERKAARRCVDCAAGLQEGDTIQCVECKERARIASSRYNAKRRARKNRSARESSRRMRERDRKRYNAAHSESYYARKARGQCVECREQASEDNVRCAYHREKQRARTLNHWRRTHGSPRIRNVVEMAAVAKSTRRKAIVEQLPDIRPEVAEYRPIDERRRTSRNALLLALRFQDWIASFDLFDAMSVPLESQDAERNRLMARLSSMVREGLVERIGKPNGYLYRLTDLGRAQADELRSVSYEVAA